MMLAMITTTSPFAKFMVLWLICALLLCTISSTTDSEFEPEFEPTVKYDENNHAKLKSDNKSSETFLFKMRYEKTLKRLKVPIHDGKLHFDMDELRGRIIYIFGLPKISELEISYIDEDGELVTMTDENDLVDIMTQKKLQHCLRMYVKLINKETAAPAGAQARLEPVPTSGASESGWSYDSLDDFFIYECL
ncbi:protein JOKA2-like [Apium graveolens]|uniref:protein JOKA2-like n=1 Tax=Apium graveolens TaxID=4045 RepID=UPI003D7AC0E2